MCLIQIHDELDLSVESPEQAKKVVEIMENAVKLEVPNKVDFECGKTYRLQKTDNDKHLPFELHYHSNGGKTEDIGNHSIRLKMCLNTCLIS